MLEMQHLQSDKNLSCKHSCNSDKKVLAAGSIPDVTGFFK
jgi:hypothetical protein